MIPEAAVEAAAEAAYNATHKTQWWQLSTGYKRELLPPARAALEAAAPHMLAAKAAEAKANNDHIIEGGDGYSAGFHYALHCIHDG